MDAAFNHPPSMISVLRAMMWLAKTTGIFFPFWLRLPAILADAASLWVLSRIFSSRLNERTVRWTLFLVAVSPTLILVSGFHGNTDPVVMLFVLISVWITEADGSRSNLNSNPRDWASGAAFGAAMCVKILPLVVLPVLFFCRAGLRRRIVFLASAAAVMLVAWSPWLFRDPVAIYHQVLGYQSIYGQWGLSLLAYHLTFFKDSWHDAFQQYGAWVLLAVISVAAAVVNRKHTRPAVYTQTGAALFFFLAAANGFGVQYLAWLIPWTVGIPLIPAVFFSLASGAFLFAVYNFWAGGFPWYLADSNYVGGFIPHLEYLLTVAWLSVIVLAWTVWKVSRGWDAERPASFPSRRARLLSLALAISAIAWPLWNQVIRVDARAYPPSVDRAAIDSIHAHEHAMLSEQYYKLGRYQDAVVAARTGIALDSTLVEAWNNLARACIRLGRLDEAANAANTAVQLAPDDEDARANIEDLLSAGRTRH